MNIRPFTGFFRRHLFLIISLSAAVISTTVLRPEWRQLLQMPDYRVLGLLFALMTVIRGFCDARLPDAAALFLLRRCRRLLPLYLVLTVLIFFFSMAVTNDVALLTFVPLTLTVCRYLNIVPIRILVIETIAANLGSALTPMGNPQNLFLYSYYHLSPGEFFAVTAPLTAAAFVFLLPAAASAAGRDSQNGVEAAALPPVPAVKKRDGAVWAVLLTVLLGAVFRAIEVWQAVALTAVVVSVVNPKLWLKTDYSLLAVFTALFIFTGNLTAVPALKKVLPQFLGSPVSACFSAAALSQVISNVPAALLTAPFTGLWRPLLLGVNLGGLGTLIASLASVITYQFYIREANASSKRYLLVFTVFNALFFVLLIPVTLLIL